MSEKAGKAKAAVADRASGGVEASPEEIAIRAYEIHLSEGGGDELENWLRAEHELGATTDVLPGPDGAAENGHAEAGEPEPEA